jgi:hypothetical protein
MYVPRCRYIKTNGLVCKSPSLNKSAYCYFHKKLHDRYMVYRSRQTSTPGSAAGAPLAISALEDTESVQLALSVVINALAAGDLDPQRARALLYGLQLAASNARHMSLETFEDWDLAREIDPEHGTDCTAPAGEEVEIWDPESQDC